MSAPDEHARYADSAGAYLLGALDEIETDAFERHLAGCVACADELDRLRVGADALPRSVEPLSPPPALKRDLMRTVRAEARGLEAAPRRRSLLERLGWSAGPSPRLAVAAAGGVLLVGAALGYGITQLGDSSGGGRVISAEIDRTRVPGATATLAVADSGAGGAVLRVAGLPSPGAGQVYEVWLKRGGSVVPASLFSVGADGRGAAGIATGLRGVDLVMVTREAAGGSAKPTQAPLISVKT